VKRFLKHLRLLPAVVIVGFAVLAFKGIDIARAAQGVADDLNATLAPTDPGSGTSPHADFANGEDPSDSASEVDVLTSLTQRRAQLDARERGLAMRENLINATEGRVNQKIAALQSLQTQIQGLLKARDDAQQMQIDALIKSYGPDGMKPAQAAAIFNTMPDEVLVPIAKGMKPADLGAIMAKMNPEAAQKLTVKLAVLLRLPETAVTAACPVPPTAADAGTPPAVASATPESNPPVTLDTPPQQTAAATPPPAATPAPATTPAPPAAAASAPAKPQQTAATTPPPATTPTPAPAKPQTAAAATPPKPAHHAPPHHVANAAPPARPTNPPVTLDKPAAPTPSQTAAATPPKPATPSSTTPSQAAAAPPPKPSATTPAPAQSAAATPPPATTPAPAPATPAPAPASTAPTPLTH
jgi:flagellar motility protein MotE (MotC chaperone)